MYIDDTNPRLALQPETHRERRVLRAIQNALDHASTHELGPHTAKEIAPAWWTYDVPEYPGLDDDLHRIVDRQQPGEMALIIDYRNVAKRDA
ncbi:hypothetical protein [Haladaptatus cibarius]|uniref:hypothetical protein n=1 Tax=Haladaptatus cibarius TaxID=453847 RepID=UPI0006790E2A|nr:hypothetical protein [Haladaptatus cibarius]